MCENHQIFTGPKEIQCTVLRYSLPFVNCPISFTRPAQSLVSPALLTGIIDSDWCGVELWLIYHMGQCTVRMHSHLSAL